jgi:bifunctional non-homologous end joining protein LigD
MLARRDGAGVRLLTRRGIDWTTRYPAIAAAIAALACRSCLIDGEVVICGEDGIPVFDRLRYGRQPQSEAVLFAFDLLELGGKDLRRTQLEERKGVLAKLVRKASWAVQLNEHIAERGDIVFRHACKLGFEGIVSKRLGSPYVSGRSRHWIKSKNRHTSGEAGSRSGLGRKTMAMIGAGQDVVVLNRTSASRSSGQWSDDDFDVLAEGGVVGRIFKVNASRNEVAREGLLLSSHQKGVCHVQTTYGGYCACNRSATCFGANHGPVGRRPNHRAKWAELRCRNSR